MSDNLENVFLRLGYALRESKRYQNTTIILGAGCSLSSTSRDISTVGIMKQCLIEHNLPESEVNAYTWETLYQNFINIVWEGKAKKERELLLKNKLIDVEPSSGHMFLRELVKNGFINTVITTNFDMLLENAFEGLSYNKRVGSNQYQVVGDAPSFNLLKVHGDLEEGSFRFAPHELMKLPESLQQDIMQKTSGLLLFVGYRGQDIGLMNSISPLNDFAVYWIDIREPSKENVFSYKHIYEFMIQRNSINNFLYGKEFGDFQKITEKLFELIVEPKHSNIIKSKELGISKEWNNTSIIELLAIYGRLYELFLDILNVSNQVSRNLHSNYSLEFDLENYNNYLHTYLYFFKSHQLPSKLLHIPKNEVDALIIGVSIEILVQSFVCDVSCESYISFLQTEFCKEEKQAKILDSSFWNTVLNIVGKSNKTQQAIKLNMQNRLTLENYDIPLDTFHELIKVVRFLSLLMPNSIKSKQTENEDDRLHRLLVEQYQGIEISENKITVNFGQLTQSDINKLLDMYIEDILDVSHGIQQTLNSNQYIILDSKWITVKIGILQEEFVYEEPSSLFIQIKNRGIQTSKQFLMLANAFDSTKSEYIELQLDKDLCKFLDSDYPAIFISGSSGSGKTSALQKFVYNNKNNESIIMIVVTPKLTQIKKSVLDLFINLDIEISEEDTLLSNINSSMEVRNTQLILVFDGINEVDNGIKAQQILYCALVTLAQKIYENKYHAIKLIITCRQNAYRNYVNATLLHLNPRYFYTNKEFCAEIMESEDASYRIVSLGTSEKDKLIKFYLGDIYTDKIRTVFSDVEITPFWIAIMGETIKKMPNSNIIQNISMAYDIFSQTMLARIESENIFLAQKIIYSYFDSLLEISGDCTEVTRFNILEKLPIQYHSKFDIIIRELEDVNILIHAKNNLKCIKFCHDKIEEFFLKEYIEEFEHTGKEFFIRIFQLSKKNDIYKEGIIKYFTVLLERNQYRLYMNSFIDSFDTYVDDIIPNILVLSLSSSLNITKHLYNLLHDNDEKNGQKLINLIVWGLNRELIDYSKDSKEFFNVLDTLLNISNDIKISSSNIASLFYFQSKIKYYENAYSEAQNLLNLALKKVPNDNFELLSQIRIHNAIINMELGFSEKSINLLEKEVENCKLNFNTNKYIDLGIELGRALNHSGQTDRVLNLYEELEHYTITNPYTLSRLYEQKANVLNRMMFENLQYGFVKTSELSQEILVETEKLFQEAVDLYDKAIAILLKINALWSYTGVVPELINTYVSYSYSIREMGMDQCQIYINEVDKILVDFTTPFTTDFCLAKAYYYEYQKKYEQAEQCIYVALKNARNLDIKTKEAKCYHFYSQFIYRQLLNTNNSQTEKQKDIDLGINYINKALDYYQNYTLVSNNSIITDCIMLKNSLNKLSDC